METKEIKLRVPDAIQSGTFANNTMITHSKEEFFIDYIVLAPPGGTVVSRVIVTPAHFKRIISTMQDNLNKYEDSFGPVEASKTPPTNRGVSG